jgi:hypothetical protein
LATALAHFTAEVGHILGDAGEPSVEQTAWHL